MAGGGLAFAVQKHRARALHYDLRLEMGGVMPSWSIPKGPTLDSGVRRLAMPTSDHPLEYRSFEGVLGGAPGEGGVVMVWDEGTYCPEVEVGRGVLREVAGRTEGEEAAGRGFAQGNLKFRLYGKRLGGSFALVKTAGLGGRDSWLLIKHRDGHSRPGYDAGDYDTSAVSGRTLEQIASQDTLDGTGRGRGPAAAHSGFRVR